MGGLISRNNWSDKGICNDPFEISVTVKLNGYKADTSQTMPRSHTSVGKTPPIILKNVDVAPIVFPPASVAFGRFVYWLRSIACIRFILPHAWENSEKAIFSSPPLFLLLPITVVDTTLFVFLSLSKYVVTLSPSLSAASFFVSRSELEIYFFFFLLPTFDPSADAVSFLKHIVNKIGSPSPPLKESQNRSTSVNSVKQCSFLSRLLLL